MNSNNKGGGGKDKSIKTEFTEDDIGSMAFQSHIYHEFASANTLLQENHIKIEGLNAQAGDSWILG